MESYFVIVNTAFMAIPARNVFEAISTSLSVLDRLEIEEAGDAFATTDRTTANEFYARMLEKYGA